MRRNRMFKIWIQQQCFLMFFLIIFMLMTVSVILRNVELKQQILASNHNNDNVKFSAVMTTPAFSSLPNSRHVTKSMSELGKMDEINQHILFLNFIPNYGAEVLIFLLQKMQGFNSYRHVRLKSKPQPLTTIEEERLVDEIYDEIRNAAVPLSFDQPVRFINFTAFDKQSPTFINLIREPVENILSRSSSKSKPDYKTIVECLQQISCYQKYYQPYIPHFCGHSPNCNEMNSFEALQMAKSNIEKYYPVVGVLEELNATLEVLEAKIPYFFKGVQNLYKKTVIVADKFNNKKTKSVENIYLRKTIKNVLVQEYELYNWIKGRLFQQLQVLYGEHHSH